ncbi:MAG: phosphoribosylformylglycinamidine cyclo-ligase, partial [Lachnospiraceae bacterium]|nr:phosphoribosylformylglycinamidine cyclo-ligase [Lachnospiraceae bacterium]
VLAVDKVDVDKTMETLSKAGETCYVIGEVVAGEKGVDLV